MPLSFLTKLRITLVIGLGVIVLGILAWPLAAPATSYELVSFSIGTISSSDAVLLIALAVLLGLVAYFIAWPYGRYIAVLAVPSGLALWAVRSGNIASVMQLEPTVQQRQTILTQLSWEPIFWLIVVAAGFAGVWIGRKIKEGAELQTHSKKAESKTSVFLSSIIAMVGSVLLAQFCLGLFAQDVRLHDGELGMVVAQPAVGQIIFAVLLSFGIIGFAAKRFFGFSYIYDVFKWN